MWFAVLLPYNKDWEFGFRILMGLSYYLIVFIQIYSSMCIHVFISVCVSVSVFKHKVGMRFMFGCFLVFGFLFRDCLFVLLFLLLRFKPTTRPRGNSGNWLKIRLNQGCTLECFYSHSDKFFLFVPVRKFVCTSAPLATQLKSLWPWPGRR